MFLQTGHTYKSFAEQKSFSFVLNADLSNTLGFSAISLSGDNSCNLFSFYSGRILDPEDRWVDSYCPLENFEISGNINSGFLGYCINNKPICLNMPISPEDSSFDSFVFYTSGADFNFSIDVWGSTVPSYDLIFPNIGLTGQSFTGYLKNNSDFNYQSFKIFSGSVVSSTHDYFLSSDLIGLKIKPQESGSLVFEYSGNKAFALDSNKQAYPSSGLLSLVFDFGTKKVPFDLPVQASPFYFLNLEPGLVQNFGKDITFWGLDLERQACSGTSFVFSLKDFRWLDPYYSFSDSVFVKSGYKGLDSSFSAVPYQASFGGFIGTGFIPSAGCSGNDSSVLVFEILNYHPSGSFLNKLEYSISGIEDPFVFTGFLNESSFSEQAVYGLNTFLSENGFYTIERF